MSRTSVLLVTVGASRRAPRPGPHGRRGPTSVRWRVTARAAAATVHVISCMNPTRGAASEAPVLPGRTQGVSLDRPRPDEGVWNLPLKNTFVIVIGVVGTGEIVRRRRSAAISGCGRGGGRDVGKSRGLWAERSSPHGVHRREGACPHRRARRPQLSTEPCTSVYMWPDRRCPTPRTVHMQVVDDGACRRVPTDAARGRSTRPPHDPGSLVAHSNPVDGCGQLGPHHVHGRRVAWQGGRGEAPVVVVRCWRREVREGAGRRHAAVRVRRRAVRDVTGVVRGDDGPAPRGGGQPRCCCLMRLVSSVTWL